MAEREPSKFSEQWKKLAVDSTVPLAVDATIRPPPDRVAGRARTRQATVQATPNSHLPVISMALGTDPSALPRPMGGREPDLTLGECLGVGGMGKVLLAEQRSLQRKVAVKILREDANAALKAALISEAVLTGSLAHPGIIPVHALGVDDQGRPVLVMKRIEGASWGDLVSDPDHPAWAGWEERAGNRLLAHLEILSQVCDAVEFAHSRGVVHRDIKPQNVMLGNFGEVYLVDWGVATKMDLPPQGELVGTPAYMAPEMVRGDGPDERTDVYLLGATLHEVITGRHRHGGDSLRDVLQAAYVSDPVEYSDDVPVSLANLCNAATAADPAARPPSASAFRAGIADYLRHRTSVSLCEAAEVRLHQLEELLADERGASAEALAVDATALAAEARFGFSQALDEWSDNSAAASGLERCLAAQVRIHLERRDADGARAILASMSTPPADLSTRVDELLEELAAERRERERLENLERELDASVGVRGRLFATLALAAAAVGITAYTHLQTGGTAAVTHAEVFGFSVFVLVGCGVVLWVKRNQLLANAFNRRGVALLGAVIMLLVLDRGIGWARATPIREILISNAVLFAMGSAAGAIFALRWIGWLTAIFAATTIALTVLPSAYIADAFSIGTILSIIVAALLWRRTDSPT